MWKGNHRGRSTISGGMKGTARQGTWPKMARVMRVKTLLRAAPPAARIRSRAMAILGFEGSSPASFRA